VAEITDSAVILSLGGGVQSTALALMAAGGDLPPDFRRPSAAIFADTGWEPASVSEPAGKALSRYQIGRFVAPISITHNKLEPIYRFCRPLIGRRRGQRHNTPPFCEMWIGISADENARRCKLPMRAGSPTAIPCAS
jgi:3'-phosphoadenosine 5'-phosphosulfate sulfotransferase (PAPS reductase)/FAD synthetase